MMSLNIVQGTLNNFRPRGGFHLVVSSSLEFDRQTLDIFPFSKPRNSWIKWAFLFARYFPLLAGLCVRYPLAIILQLTKCHSCGRVIDSIVLYRHPIPIPLNALRTWYICQVLILHLMMLGAEIVMMARGPSDSMRVSLGKTLIGSI